MSIIDKCVSVTGRGSVISEQRGAIRSVRDREDAIVRQMIIRIIADLAALDLKSLGFKGTPEQRGLATEYIAGAFMAVLTWWLNQAAKLPPQEVEDIFRGLVMPGLATELELRPKAS